MVFFYPYVLIMGGKVIMMQSGETCKL